MPRKKAKGSVSLPPDVHKVTAKGREYFYYQRGRGTKAPGTRHALPRDTHSPEFWQAVNTFRGGPLILPPASVNAALDEWLMHLRTSQSVTLTTITFYDQSSQIARRAWGALDPKGLRPIHVEAVLDGLSSKPGAANNFLSTMRTFSIWAKKREYVNSDLTEGLRARKSDGGHKPWTTKQVAAAKAKLTGAIRRGVVLYLYTGMRGSDAVRLGPEHLDDGGFSLITQKKKRPVYCPILPELEEEMKDWDMTITPFLRQEGGRADGKPYTRKLFSRHFKEQRDKIPELAGVTLHGLRATAVVRLRTAGLSIGQMSDIVGMSMATIERYCRFLDRKASAKAGLQTLLINEAERLNVKPSKIAKPEDKEIKKIGVRR